MFDPLARAIRHFPRAISAALLFVAINSPVTAGLFGDGEDARSIALGGVEAAQNGSAISAMNSNPAALTSATQTQFEIDLGGAFVSGKFNRENGGNAATHEFAALAPAAALAIPLSHNLPVTLGVGFLPDILSSIDWRYTDAPGGLGGTTSYGEQKNHSEILALCTSVGLAARISRSFSIGASIGAVYDRNELRAPYIFQSQPVLRGFKTLLDLQTEGAGVSFNFGAQFQPISTLRFGLSYRPPVSIDTGGDANGNASAQLQALGGGFAQVDPTFHYDADVQTELPQIVSAAFEWQALAQLRLVGGIDWINWSDSFDQLVIDLSHGSNSAINSVVGSESPTDIAPLRWRDQFVYRAGIEYAATDHFTLRAGYSYARSAVPPETLTPLTAAIFEHKISAGVGYRSGRYHTDLAWLWALPTRERVGQSALLDGEYSNTSVRVTAHSIHLSAGVDF